MIRIGNSELKHVTDALDKLAPYISEEREILLEYRNHIIDKGELDVKKEDYPPICRSKIAYKFFIETLKEFDAVDDSLKYIRGGQKVINAIRDCKLYRDHILSDTFHLGKYYTGVGVLVSKKFNTSKMSEYKPELLKRIKNYYKENNPFR